MIFGLVRRCQGWSLALLVLSSLLVGCRATPEQVLEPTVGDSISAAVANSTPALVQGVAATPALGETAMTTVRPTKPSTATSTATTDATVTPSPTGTSTPSGTPTTTPTATPTPTLPPTPDGTLRVTRVPILMYHYLSEPSVGSDRYRQDLSVAPDLFGQHLAYLRAEGYQSVSLYDLLFHLQQGRPLPQNPIIITFDDGYRDSYDNAFPLLQEYGFTATFFVVTELAARAADALTAPDGLQYASAYMGWEQLQEMMAAGMDIECHGRVHEDLTQDELDRLVWQVLGCREMMEAELGRRPRFVAYPSGLYDQRVIDVFASDHYWGGVTTQQDIVNRSDQLFEIKRLRVRGSTDVAQLAELLAWEER